jgi:hypothetical protein
MIGTLIGGILKPVVGIIDKKVKDKDLAEQLKTSIYTQILDNEAELGKAAANVIMAEAQSESAAARNWRPHLMYLIMFLLVFNGMVIPLANVFWSVQIPVLEAWLAIPEQMWTLLQIGLGGYIVGRSGEKIARDYFKSGEKE